MAHIERLFGVGFVIVALWLLWEAADWWLLEGYVERARLAFHSGLLSAALAQVDEALARSDTPALHQMRGSILSAQLEFSAASAEFLKVLKENPVSSAAKIGLATCILETLPDDNKAGERKRVRAKALLEGTDAEDAKVALAAIALSENNIKQAEQLLLSVRTSRLTLNGLIAYYITRSQVESLVGHHLDAMACARRAITLLPKQYGRSPKQCGAFYRRTFTCAVTCLINAAVRYTQSATHDSFPKVADDIEKNFGHNADKNFGVAANFWKDRHQTFLVYLSLGNAGYKVGRYEEALACYKEALRRRSRKRPDFLWIILLNKALTYRALSATPNLRPGARRGYLRQGCECYAQVALNRKAPKRLRYWAHLAAAQCLFEMNDFSGARRHAERAFDLADPQKGFSQTYPLLAMAVCADKEGKASTAVKLYKRALVIGDLKNAADVKRRIAQLQRRKKR
mgnify:CR=1 FL=1